jgi:hypothetical protein
MASFIKIKRSTGTISPATLQYGELAYTTGVGTHGNGGGRLFIGDQVPNAVAIGGRYYTDLLSISPGLVAGQTNPTSPANGFVPILDQNRKVDQWNVDNLTLDGNTLSSSNIDGDITIDPNGSGEVLIPDNTFLTFGSSKDTKIQYDEAVDDRLEVTGADWNFANGVSLSLSDTTQSTSSTTGALVVSGGVGISGDLFISGTINANTISGTISTATKALTVDTTTAPNGTFYPGLFVSGTGVASTTVYVDSGISYVSNTDTLTLTGDIAINGGDATTNATTFNLINATATNVNFAGAATNLNIGAVTGVATIRNQTLTLPNATTVNVNGANPTLASSSTGTLTLFNTNLTRVNAFQAASDLVFSATTGITTIRNKLTVGGNLEVDGNNIQSSTGANVITLSGNNATFANDLTVNGNTNLGNSLTDQVTITGNVNQTGITTINGELFVDAVGISSNTIYTRPGTGDKLFIDPYPDGLSNEGVVIIKGDLQVDGTTVTVNSVTVTSNNPIYVIGDNATTRTVMATVASGNQITIDSVAGINTNDVVSGTNIPSNTVISSFNAGTKVITISNAITGTIDSGSQITISQGVDTNDDRGIAFKYIASGIGTEAVVKTGFFGYVDNTSRWTYVPDASISGNVVAGTKGFLDIKGIYYQTGDYSTNGITYFDNSGLMRSTVAPGSGISTSNYILTTDASGTPTWTDTIDGGVF